MRALTLDEKISLKGVFKFKGLTLPLKCVFNNNARRCKDEVA